MDKYLTRMSLRREVWKGHTSPPISSIRYARRHNRDLEIWRETDNDYHRISAEDWDELFGEVS